MAVPVHCLGSLWGYYVYCRVDVAQVEQVLEELNNNNCLTGATRWTGTGCGWYDDGVVTVTGNNVAHNVCSRAVSVASESNRFHVADIPGIRF